MSTDHPEGRRLFAANCAQCHGSELQGTTRGPSLLSVVYAPDHHPDGAFRSAIANGVVPHHWDFGAMPPIPGLTDDDITQIIGYVRDVQQRNGFEPYPPG